MRLFARSPACRLPTFVRRLPSAFSHVRPPAVCRPLSAVCRLLFRTLARLPFVDFCPPFAARNQISKGTKGCLERSGRKIQSREGWGRKKRRGCLEGSGEKFSLGKDGAKGTTGCLGKSGEKFSLGKNGEERRKTSVSEGQEKFGRKNSADKVRGKNLADEGGGRNRGCDFLAERVKTIGQTMGARRSATF